ncbi:unnamed protein product [Owenia fusiformis]|uniref:Uncharacterized protein n=1 Tax=Owenia fusiformis TaxID=6347 RepID=A0A8J1XTQ2_OWEFU|nr:unnamed protein product [Owenia fusiformis]
MMTDLLKLTLFAYLVAVGRCQTEPTVEPDPALNEFGFLADDPDSNYPNASWTVKRNEYICYGDPHCYQSVFADATGLGNDEICYRVRGDSDAWYNIWNHTVFGVEVDCHFNRPIPGNALYIDEVNIIASYRDVNVKLVGNRLVHLAGLVKGGTGSVTIDVLGLKEIIIKIDGNVYICLRAKVNKIFVYIRILRQVPKGALQGIMGAVENQAKAVVDNGTTLELEDNTAHPLGPEEWHRWYCRRPLPRTCYRLLSLSVLIPDLNVYKLP